jgi:hypothetical protein
MFFWDINVSLAIVIFNINSQKQNGCNALRTFCFCWREPSASGATGGRLEVPKYEGRGWLLLAARGWRGFCLFCMATIKGQTIEPCLQKP